MERLYNIYIRITRTFLCIFNPYYIIRKLEGYLCAWSSTKKKRTIVSVIRDGLIPFKEGYSILIPPLSHAFSTLFLSFPPLQPPDLSFSLFHIATRAFCHWRHESHNSDRKSSLWFLARHIRRPHARAISLYVGKPSTSFLKSLGKAVELAFSFRFMRDR